MERIIVTNIFEHPDGLYRVRCVSEFIMSQKLPAILLDVSIRQPRSRDAFLLYRWRMAAGEDNQYEQPVLISSAEPPIPVTIADEELLTQYDVALREFAFKLRDQICRERRNVDDHDSSAEILLGIGLLVFWLLLH
jgi:hypothetical protein